MVTRAKHTRMVTGARWAEGSALASRRLRLTGTAVLVASTLTHGLPVVCCGHRVLRHLLDRLSTAGSPCESVEAVPVKPPPPRGQGRSLSSPSPHDHACVLASGDHDLHLIYQMYGHIPPQSTQWPSHTHYYNTHWPLGRQQGPSCRRAPDQLKVIVVHNEISADRGS